ncbi:MAG: glutamate formimidoyltransferase, partial [bacterium]
MKKIFECVPNVSEGRRPEVIEGIRQAILSAPGVKLLDVESDPDHNRSVFTFAGSAGAVAEAVYALADTAVQNIDLRTHKGEH